MKKTIPFLISYLIAASAHAEFRTWTNADGKSAELDLVSVSDLSDGKSGQFKMRSGKSVTIKASNLSVADAKLLAEWKPKTEAATPAVASIFDKALHDDLVRLSGKTLKSCKDATKPTKYYLFYYTASWCGPCHKFTPSLVQFYNKHKNASFELILITSDNSDKDMEGYAEEMKMPWPQLKLSKAAKFKKEFPYPGGGIPNLVLTDLQGKLIKGSYEGKEYVGPYVVMTHLEKLLEK